MNLSELKNYIQPGKRGHFVGIGGVSMSPLAEVVFGMGVSLTGSDMNESAAVRRLREMGIKVEIGHRAENIAGADFVVRTAAARDDNAEISAARDAGIPIFERAEAWGYIMQEYKNAVCVAGTHGKTTTTSMVAHILMAAKKDPTIMLGGTLPMLHAGHRIGEGDTIVLESCEYYNSFLSFSPTVAVILNVEADHLDFFKDLDDIKNSFHQFANRVPEEGFVIANGDDANTMDAVKGVNKRVITFGMTADSDVYAKDVKVNGMNTEFDIICDGEFFTHAVLRVPGTHNVMNALAAAAATKAVGVSAEGVSEGLYEFMGAGRRFEYKGKLNGADVYDDYAHHPGEIRALIEAMSSRDYKRIILAFQPHTYTRTKALFNEFAKELSEADVLYLAEIYAAREQNTVGISSKDLSDAIPGSVFLPTFEEIEKHIKETAKEGDVIVTVGAGDIYKVGDALVK